MAETAVLERPVALPARDRRTAAVAGAGLLSAAMLGSGLLAYVFHVVAARTLGPEEYGQIAVLWAAMFLIVVVVFRPLEQTTARAIADRVARGHEVESVLRTVMGVCAGLLAVCGLVAFLVWRPVTDGLFHGNQALTAALFGGIGGYGLAYLVRGVCGGAHWFGGYGLLLMADAVVRIVVVLPLFLVASTELAAAAVAAAAFGGFVAPVIAGRKRLRSLRGGSAAPGFGAGAAISFAMPAAVIAAADQILVNCGPLFVVLEGGKDATKTAGIVFAATMLVRIPVYVFQGVAASLLPNLTRLNAFEDRSAFSHAVRRTVVVLLGTTAVVVLGAAAVGPDAMRIVFGSGFEVTRLEVTLLGVGVGGYLAAATFSQALLALDRTWAGAVSWAVSAFAFAGLFVLIEGGALFRIAAAFAAAMTFGALLLAVQLAKQVR